MDWTPAQTVGLFLSCGTVGAIIGAILFFVLRRINRDLDGLRPEDWE